MSFCVGRRLLCLLCFADVPAVIRVNGASLDSTVSLSFLHNFNVPRSICNHDGVAAESSSGPVRVPTVDGWYNSRQIFCSVYLKGCNVELGCDWLVFVNVRFDGSRFLRPLETDLARLCAGHTWNFETGATQVGSSSSSVTKAGSQRKDRVVDKFLMAMKIYEDLI
ncbi:hypothetical protein BD769DRAFT_1724964 [Suillus cothurnatus]|nr:hypothetical protein BD769DRAFT_1724964 [Suillus cothurnatus]